MEGRRESEGLTLLIYQILRSRDEKRDLDRGDSALSPVQWWLELFFVGSSSLAQPGESWLLCLQPSLCLIHPQCWTLLSTLDVNRQTYSQILIKYSCFSLIPPALYIKILNWSQFISSCPSSKYQLFLTLSLRLSFWKTSQWFIELIKHATLTFYQQQNCLNFTLLEQKLLVLVWIININQNQA